MSLDDKPFVGISACLLGQSVRYDGGHKRDGFLVDTLGPFVEWIPVCPEVEVGMGVPRETVRLVGTREHARMIAEKSRKDWTDAMRRFAKVRREELAELKLSGYVFKKNSPSCGMERIRIYGPTAMHSRYGRGLFAAAVMTQFPLMPVEEAGRLNDPRLRENFIEGVFAFQRWQEQLAGAKSASALVQFHTRHKFLLLAHSERHYRRLGRLVGETKKHSLRQTYDKYGDGFMQALAVPVSTKKHANVLEHMMGYFSELVSAPERAELVGLIRDFRRQLVPLIAPTTLIRHYVRKYDIAYLHDQVYLCPIPKELMFRNHV